MVKKKATCINCRREMLIHAKEMCCTCYKRLCWKAKIITCPRCKRKIGHHSKGLCVGCYHTMYHLESIKDWNHQKRHNISPELYKKITSHCIICNFNKFVELHHIDHNRHNNSDDNMVGLCPNHHKMLHTMEYGPFLSEVIGGLITMRRQQTKLIFKEATENQANQPIKISIRKENSPVLVAAN